MSREPVRHIEAIAERGYTIIHDVLDPGACAAVIAALETAEAAVDARPATNDFEGSSTTRVYNLLRHDPLFQTIPTDSKVLGIVEGVLDRGCLVSSLSSVRIHPGEKPQPLHADDLLIPIERPHPAVVCNSMWALTDFTSTNGATRVLPGSHTETNHVYGEETETIAAEMPAGSVLVWHGSLWHGGGANTTDTDRIGIAMNYCAGWLRQQENQQLGLSPELVATFDERLQELVGYGIYNGLIGHIERTEPLTRLRSPGPGHGVLWDR